MSERLDRIEAILLTVAEQTAANSRSILGINQTMQLFAQEQVTLNQTMQTFAQEQVILNQTMQTLAQEQVILNQTMQTLAQGQVTLNQTIQAIAEQTNQNSRDIAELRTSIAELRDVVEQQNRAITYLISQD